MKKLSKKICILGYGYVGKIMYTFFKDHYETAVYDPLYSIDIDENKALSHEDLLDKIQAEFRDKGGATNCLKEFNPDPLFIMKDYVKDYDVVVICVNTPSNNDGSCNLTDVENAISLCSEEQLIILKSTVPVGTTDRLKKLTHKRIVFAPEYVGMSSYWTPYAFHSDARESPWFTFGGNHNDCSACIDLLMPIVGPTKKYLTATAQEAEMCKLVENTFYATKITYCYEIKQICDKLGVDYNTVRELWLADPRVNPMHTAVFAENEFPYSGKCVPADTYIMMANGSHQKISELYDLMLVSQSVFFAMSLDDKLLMKTQKRITRCIKSSYSGKIYKFKFAKNKEFVCTDNHLIPVERAGIRLLLRAADIKNTDRFFLLERNV